MWAFSWLLTWFHKESVKVLTFPLVRPPHTIKYWDTDHPSHSLSEGEAEGREVSCPAASGRNRLQEALLVVRFYYVLFLKKKNANNIYWPGFSETSAGIWCLSQNSSTALKHSCKRVLLSLLLAWKVLSILSREIRVPCYRHSETHCVYKLHFLFFRA